MSATEKSTLPIPRSKEGVRRLYLCLVSWLNLGISFGTVIWGKTQIANIGHNDIPGETRAIELRKLCP